MRRMGAIGKDQLTSLALRTVEETATEAFHGPARRTSGVALALAWLLHFANQNPPARWPFENFWDALIVERDHDRQAAVTAAMNAIFLVMDRHRRDGG